jgi:hypothetical protein
MMASETNQDTLIRKGPVPRPPQPEEFRPGLVLFLDPAAPCQAGARCTVTAEFRNGKCRPYVCLGVTGETSFWAPTFSSPPTGALRDRAAVPTERAGHWKWTESECYVHPAQVWILSKAAVLAGWQGAGDMTSPGNRNWLLSAACARLARDCWEIIELWEQDRGFKRAELERMWRTLYLSLTGRGG